VKELDEDEEMFKTEMQVLANEWIAGGWFEGEDSEDYKVVA
jgi:hypothetical protein